MTEITATICRPKQKISWLTAPGIQRVEKQPLDRSIEDVFNVPKGSLTEKHRIRDKVDARHLYRYILERMLNDGTLAGDEVKRARYIRRRLYKSYISLNHRMGVYDCQIIRPKAGIRFRQDFATLNEAKKAVDDIFKKIEGRFFKYSIYDLTAICNCENHASIIYARKTVQNLFETDKSFRAKAQIILDKISNNQIILP